MINNLQEQVAWVKRTNPHITPQAVIDLIRKPFPKDKLAPIPQVPDSIPSSDKENIPISKSQRKVQSRLPLKTISANESTLQSTPTPVNKTRLPPETSDIIDLTHSPPKKRSPPQPSSPIQPTPKKQKLDDSVFRKLLGLHESKIKILEEKFFTSESTLISLDQKKELYKKLESQIELLDNEINALKLGLDDSTELSSSPDSPEFRVPITRPVRLEAARTIVESTENEEDDTEDHFGDQTMDGLLTPTQERMSQDDLNEMASFIDDRTFDITSQLSDGEFIAVESDTEINDIRLSPETATKYGIKYNSQVIGKARTEVSSPISRVPAIPEIDSSDSEPELPPIEEDEIEETTIPNLQSGPDSPIVIDDDDDDFLDFTTQLNKEREIDFIELDSDDDVQEEQWPKESNAPPAPPAPPAPAPTNPVLTIDSDDAFSDDDEDLKEYFTENRASKGSEPFMDEVHSILNNVFKLKSFRANQLEAVLATLLNKDVFVLMPTGGGKSLCYQLPALVKSGATKGTTVVISPLISLMQDQVQHLLAKNIKAGMFSSKGGNDDNKHTIHLFREGFLDIVYLSPERANKSNAMQTIMTKLYNNNQLARVVIDEAHCLSSWGHDFRPDYQGLGFFKDKFPKVPIMALTATANEKVQMDILHNLKMKDPVLLKQSFNRTNLFYEIKLKKSNCLLEIKDYILSRFLGKSGIIYCHSKQSCEHTSMKLNEYGLKTSFYHAGMSADKRFNIQKRWQENKIQVICATIAFGMGIDKPDVRFVIHLYLPRTLEGYYQETGRAGRDGNFSECVMYYCYKDARSLQNLIQRDEELSELGRESHLAKLRQVIQYCENTTDCRRKQVLQYFNETFDPANCHKQCDNCRDYNHVTLVEKDCTEYAKDIIKLVKSIQDEQVTVLYCQDVFRGLSHKKITEAGHHENEYHGKGQSLDKNDVERIFFYLLSQQCIVEYHVMHGGFATDYVKVGKNADVVLNGQKKIIILFSSRPGSASNSLGRTAANTGKPVEYQESFITARQMTTVDVPDSLFSQRCLQELREAREKALTECSISNLQIVGEVTLRDMLAKLPTNKKDFAKLEGIKKGQLEHFTHFKKILTSLAREKKKMANTSISTVVSDISSISTSTVSPYFQPSQQDQEILDTLRAASQPKPSKSSTQSSYTKKKGSKKFNKGRSGNYFKKAAPKSLANSHRNVMPM